MSITKIGFKKMFLHKTKMSLKSKKDEQRCLLSEIKIYPNPTNNSLNLSYELSDWGRQGESNDTIHLKIYNILGKLVYNVSKVVDQGPKISYNIDASNFRSGTYYVTLSQNGKLITSKKFVNPK